MYSYYMIHDAANHYEKQLDNFDPNYIKNLFDSGLSIVGITDSGRRENIKRPEDVIETKKSIANRIPIVLPSYIDSKIEELAGVVETLVDSLPEESLTNGKTKMLMLNKLTDIRVKAKQSIEKEMMILEKAGAKIEESI